MNSVLNLGKLIAVCGVITGRKKLQKIVHLLQVAGFKSDFPHDFGYLHFGPYSHGVKHDLDLLTSEKLVQEQPTDAGGHPTFRYSPTPELTGGLDAIGIAASPAWEDEARRLNKQTPQRLEAASTIAFLRERGFKGEQLRTRFRELKPFLDHDFEAAALLLPEAGGAESTGS